MASVKFFAVAIFLALVVLAAQQSEGAIPYKLQRKINAINRDGPYLGIVIPNAYEMNPLLKSKSYVANKTLPYLDFAGRRFRFGTIAGKKSILVMTGLAMLNAGITTQLLLSLFRIKGVVHYGIAGNANPILHIGDVAIPDYWAHTGLWNWQRYGNGPINELALEANGDYTRKIGYLEISNFTTVGNKTNSNLLNNVWYQPEEVFPVSGTPEVRQHAFWVPVDKHYYELTKQIKNLKLQRCLNSTTCLPYAPKVARVERGTSASIYLDNASYRTFIREQFSVSPVEMESASVALICLQQQIPFIVIRSLSDLAGGGSAQSNEADTFSDVAANNAVTVAIEFIKLL